MSGRTKFTVSLNNMDNRIKGFKRGVMNITLRK